MILFVNDRDVPLLCDVTNDRFCNIESLNEKHRLIFDNISNCYSRKDSKKLFYIDGPGGSRKSYLLNTIIRYMNSVNVKMLVVAWTRILASSDA